MLTYANTDTINTVVTEEIISLLTTNNTEITSINADDQLNAHLALTSLDLAQLIAALEIRLDADPFAQQTPITSIRTVGDLVRAYQQFFSTEHSEPQVSAALLDTQQRAAARRRR